MLQTQLRLNVDSIKDNEVGMHLDGHRFISSLLEHICNSQNLTLQTIAERYYLPDTCDF
jgi:hypothetical protein